MQSKKYKIAIFPDTFAHYRAAVFNNLADPSWELDVYFSERKKGGNYFMYSKKSASTFEQCSNKEYYLGKLPIYQTEVISQVLSGRYDVVVMWGAYFYLSHWLACLLNKAGKRRTRVVMWTHGFTGRESKWKKMLRKAFYRLADGLLLYGERSKEKMLQDGFDPQKLFVIYNSLNTVEQNDIYRDLKSKQNRAQILRRYFPDKPSSDEKLRLGVYTGRIQQRKRLGEVVEAVKILRSKGVDFRCVIVGTGDEKGTLARAIGQEGLNDFVVLHEPLYDESELGELFMAADVAVSPGATGLLVNHALVYGTPIVTHADLAFQGPEVEAVVNGVNGCLFPQGNVVAFAEAITKAFELKKNPAAVREVIVKKYNLDTQKKVFRTMVESLLGRECCANV